MTLQDLSHEFVTPISRPIDYRKITEEDFPNDTFILEEAENLQTGENDYLSDRIIGNISDDADLTIVNVETGRGKTYAILKKIEDFYNAGQDYLIIVATPTKPLVNKYFESLKARDEIDANQVMHYNNIPVKEENIREEDISKKIQVLTINMLLGNPGGSSFDQIESKRVYQERLRSYCNENGRKVIMILDEIHEGVYNFQPRFFPNLLKWKDHVHKVIVLSATYSEPSFPVIRKLVGLTDMDDTLRYKIKVIECERVKKLKQADLELLFVKGNYSQFDLSPLYVLQDIIRGALNTDAKVNILCYSRKLAIKLANAKTGIGGVFRDHGGLNVAVADQTNIRFDPNRHNLGTTFKSGIDITEENSLFIIIPPPSTENSNEYKNPQELAGIFTNGANEVIQAVARLRNGGRILIVIPEPTLFIDGLYFGRYIGNFPFKDYIGSYREAYLPFHSHKGLIKSFYDQLESRNREEINYLNIKRAEKKLPDVHWHTFDEYLLEYGQKFLTYRYASCGFKVVPFIIWAAYNDQFANCTLKSIRFSDSDEIIDVSLKSETIIEDMINFYRNNFPFVSEPIELDQTEDVFEISKVEKDLKKLNDREAFEHLLKLLKKKTNISLNENPVADPAKKVEITRTIIQLVGTLKIGSAFLDEEYTREDYILDNITIAFSLANSNINAEEQELCLSYKRLGEIRNEFLTIISGNEYLPVNFEESGLNFNTISAADLKNIVDILNAQDYLFKRKIYSLRLEFGETDSLEVKKGKAYNLLKEFFLMRYNERKIKAESGKRNRIFQYKVITTWRPDAKYSLNFNFPKSYTREGKFGGKVIECYPLNVISNPFERINI